MIVAAGDQPDFVRHPRSVWAKRVVISLDIHDALAIALFLANRVAKNAAFLLSKPFVGGRQFVFQAPRHKHGRGNLARLLTPSHAGLRALVLENADVFEARILFKVPRSRSP